MLVGIRDNVAALKKAGRALAETVAAKPTATYDAKWGQFVIDPPFIASAQRGPELFTSTFGMALLVRSGSTRPVGSGQVVARKCQLWVKSGH